MSRPLSYMLSTLLGRLLSDDAGYAIPKRQATTAFRRSRRWRSFRRKWNQGHEAIMRRLRPTCPQCHARLYLDQAHKLDCGEGRKGLTVSVRREG